MQKVIFFFFEMSKHELFLFNIGMSQYTVIDDNRDSQSNNYRYRVNLVCDNIPVLAITTIFKMNRSLNTTCK